MRLPIQDARARGADWVHRLLDSAAAQTAERGWLPRVGFLTAMRTLAGDPMRLRKASAEGARSRAAVLFLVGNRAAEDRARRQCRELEAVGVSARYLEPGALAVDRIVRSFAAIVLDGVETTPRISRLLARAREAGRLVVVDGADFGSAITGGPAGLRDALARRAEAPSRDRSLLLNFVMRAPLAERSGSAQTVFRIANDLGRRGHRVRVFVDPVEHLADLSPGQIVDYVERSFGPLAVEPVIGRRDFDPSDVAIATCWRTAAVVATDPGALFRMRFLQDFEETHYPSRHRYHHRAQRTYGLPLHIVALGSTLARRFERRTGQLADAIDAAVDTSVFRMTVPPADRDGPMRVLFYARPDLRQRGYELGVESLRRFLSRCPDAEITVFGAMEERLRAIDFPHRSIGIPSREELAAEMNRTHALLSISLSERVSWVPLQAIACGAAVVETDACGLRDVLPEGAGCRIAEPTPASITNRLVELAAGPESRAQFAQAGADAMAGHDWSETVRQFEDLLLGRTFLATDEVARPAHLVRTAAGSTG